VLKSHDGSCLYVPAVVCFVSLFVSMQAVSYQLFWLMSAVDWPDKGMEEGLNAQR
jgi:hypothetical protein